MDGSMPNYTLHGCLHGKWFISYACPATKIIHVIYVQIQPQENYISLSWHQKDYVETKELEPSKPREDPTPIQHHTTYCQKEPFVETQNLFLHFARADFRDVD